MEIAKRIDAAIEYLNKAHEESKKGIIINLDGFQDEVRDICVEVVKLPTEDAMLHAEKFQILSDKLSDFEVDLRQKQLEVQNDIQNLNTKKKALKSYNKVSHSGNSNDNTED
ncbi:MAG: hypothetical protein COV36_05275 [Alphaproteobacteria bacterium CG11_big_fil_rev_8_21_14_0_20_44_7]|nr:MAG: hypothetical protein COV36_05275 [Alphaproteobacteria bacterium CG11_big_fil_rev_8_21_14_0_20_44_7]